MPGSDQSTALEFLSEYRALFDQYKVSIKTGAERPLPAEAAQVVLNRFLTRALLVAFLQSKGWLEFRGHRDYLQAVYEDWVSNPGGHLFHQRLALLFFNALDEPRPAARRMLEPQIGEVPYIGGGVFSPEQYEKESETGKGVAVFPEELFSDLFSADGLLSRYSFSCAEGSDAGVTPEVMGAVLGAFLGHGEVPVYENTLAHRKAVRRLIAAQLGAKQSLELPTSRPNLAEWKEGLRGLHVYDGECSSGTYLVAALEELTDLAVRLEGGERGVIKRRVAMENLRGLDQDELAVQVARFRLALALVSGDDSPRPLPDLRQIIKKGGTLSASRTLPPEGAHVEYKASFEWDPRRSQRSPEMRFGSLRTVAAFLNSEGGVLYLGVDDDGVPVGLDGDFALIEDASPCDVFENRFREFMKNALDPLPLNSVAVTFEEMEGQVVCVVSVSAAAHVTYLLHKDPSGQKVESVFVRDGNRTIELKGRNRDQFVLERRGAFGS